MRGLSRKFGSEWRLVKGTGEKYAVSRDGRVASLQRPFVPSDRLLRQRNDKYGYRVVLMCLKEGQKTRKVHRLVADAFIRNPSRKATVNHKSGIKSDNSVSNLEWATNKENVDHSWKSLGRKPSKHQAEVASKLWSGSGNPKWKDGRRMGSKAR